MPWNSLNIKISHEEGLAYIQCGDGGFTKREALEDVEKKFVRSVELLGNGQDILDVWRQAMMQDSSTVIAGDLIFTAHYYNDDLLDKVSTAALLATEAYVFSRFKRFDLFANSDIEKRRKFFAQHPGARGMRPLIQRINSGRITEIPPLPYIMGEDG